MSHLFKRFSRDIIGLVWLSMGFFIGLSLWSYNVSDPSFNSIGSGGFVQNYCGYFGSFLADILYQLLGMSAFILVAVCFRMAYKSFKNIKTQNMKWQAMWVSLLVLTGSSLLALHLPEHRLFSGQISLGGLLGKVISGSLISAFNYVGVTIILWTAAIVFVVFYTEKSLQELMQPFQKFFQALRETIRVKSIFRSVTTTTRNIILKMKVYFSEPQLLTSRDRASELHKEKKMLAIKSDAEEKAGAPGEAGLQLALGEPSEDSDMNNDESATIDQPIKRRPISLKKKVERRIENWELPKISILEDPPYNRKKVDEREIRDKAQRLLNKLKNFSIDGEVVDAKPGPAVTMFEYKPSPDVKISRITDLADDLSLELSSESVRIIAPIPGRDVVGIETSNSVRETVYLKEILASDEFWAENMTLPLAIGCEADGSQKVVDLRKIPHMLVAGTTGSGKSVFVVSLLTGLLFRHSPKTLRLILIDPKQVDLAAFSRIPHLLMPPIREPKKAINALKWAIREMEKRYRSMAKFASRDLETFNKTVTALSSSDIAAHEQANAELETTQSTQMYYYTQQPYTVIVVEEFGDLMSVDKSNVEHCVVRLAQMARACGIHLMLAMQSPRKDVVTGLIKTNIPGRVSFKVASKMDSRIILDESGAERLLTRGDMLYLAPGVSKPQRHHGPWVTDKEIQEVCEFWTNQAEPEFDPLAMRALEGSAVGTGATDETPDFMGEEDSEYDQRYDEILAYVGSLKEVSASHIQTRFRLGYPRAARLIEVFEKQGVVGPASGSKKRQVLINELK